MLERGWKVVRPFEASYHRWTVRFSHRPVHPLQPGTINVHGHLHQRPAQTVQHLNASVERLDYRPRKLGHLLSEFIAQLGNQQPGAPGQ